VNNPDRAPGTSKARLNFGRFSVPIPASRPLRIALGLGLCLGGFLGFLPILGFWMFPLGLLVLSVDLAPVRRFRRRMEVRWGRRKKKRQED
jgi:hypothetical protein